jgi:hypothetical protein
VRRRVALGGVLVALGHSSLARAEEVPVELTWKAPAGCPSREAVLSRVRELVGAAASSASLLRAYGEIKQVGNGFELRLATEVEGRHGERRVRSARCEDLRGVAAVTLTLLLTSGAPPEPEPVPESEPKTTEPSSEEPSRYEPLPPMPTEYVPPPAATDESTRAWRLLVALPQAGFQLGPLPKPALELSVGVGLEGSWWSFRLLGQWASEQRVQATTPGYTDYGAQAQRAAVGLWACVEHRVGALSVAPCLVGSAARLHATGFGPSLIPVSTTEFTWGAGAGAVGRARLTSWLSLMAGVSGQVELNRPQLWVDSLGQVRRLAPFSALAVVGPEWIF